MEGPVYPEIFWGELQPFENLYLMAPCHVYTETMPVVDEKKV